MSTALLDFLFRFSESEENTLRIGSFFESVKHGGVVCIKEFSPSPYCSSLSVICDVVFRACTIVFSFIISFNNIFHRSSSFKSVTNIIRVLSCSVCPFSQRKSLTFVREQSIVSFVSTILLSCSPSAVLRGVRAVIVDSINLMFGRRTPTHVSKEVFVTIPTSADSDSSAPISGVGLRFWVVAPLTHGIPSSVF